MWENKSEKSPNNQARFISKKTKPDFLFGVQGDDEKSVLVCFGPGPDSACMAPETSRPGTILATPTL